MKKLKKLSSKIEGFGFEKMSEDALNFITGGNVAGAGGFQTSGTSSDSTFCCDGTCVCHCVPPPPPPPK